MATTFSANRSALFFLFSSFFFRPTIDPEEIETDSFYFSFSFFYLFLVLLLLLFLVFLFSFFFIFYVCGKYFFVQTLSIVADSVSVVLGGRGQFARRRLADFISIFFGISFFLFGPNIHCRLLRDLFSLSVRGFRFFLALFWPFLGVHHPTRYPLLLHFLFLFLLFVLFFIFYFLAGTSKTRHRPVHICRTFQVKKLKNKQ